MLTNILLMMTCGAGLWQKSTCGSLVLDLNYLRIGRKNNEADHYPIFLFHLIKAGRRHLFQAISSSLSVSSCISVSSAGGSGSSLEIQSAKTHIPGKPFSPLSYPQHQKKKTYFLALLKKRSGRLFTSRAGIQITAKEMVKGGAFFGTFVGVGFGIRC